MSPIPTDPIQGPGELAGPVAVPHSTQREGKRKSPSPRRRRKGRRGGEFPPDLRDPEAMKKLVDGDQDDIEHVDYLA